MNFGLYHRQICIMSYMHICKYVSMQIGLVTDMVAIVMEENSKNQTESEGDMDEDESEADHEYSSETELDELLDELPEQSEDLVMQQPIIEYKDNTVNEAELDELPDELPEVSEDLATMQPIIEYHDNTVNKSQSNSKCDECHFETKYSRNLKRHVMKVHEGNKSK